MNIDEHTLFNVADMGIVEAGLRAVKIDLDIPVTPHHAVQAAEEAALRKFIWIENADGNGDLLAIISYKCPQWFEPIKRRLALNDLEWVDANGINNIDDYDPWSKCVLDAQLSSQILTGSLRE